MKLQPPSLAYNRLREIERNRKLEEADRSNMKRDQDVEIGSRRLILTSPDGSRWSVTVSDAGALTATAL
jgi:hypothetical protein